MKRRNPLPNPTLNTKWEKETDKDGTKSQIRQTKSEDVRGRGYKTFFMLNSTEDEIFPLHKC